MYEKHGFSNVESVTPSEMVYGGDKFAM